MVTHAQQYAREYYLKHHERLKKAHRENTRIYFLKHKQSIMEKRKLKARELKVKTLAIYGPNGKPECVVCGENRVACLSIDHVNNDGYAHRKVVRAKMSMYQWLEKELFPLGFQTLCMNCQWIKRDSVCRR